jgi:nucleoside-diphosphate-sugar epimerase
LGSGQDIKGRGGSIVKVLVTGASGLLGSHIVEKLLLRGDRVRALCRRRPRPAMQNVEVLGADIRDRHRVVEACSGVDGVIHVAGLAGIWGPAELYQAVNVRGTENALHGCVTHRVRWLVYTSSPSVTFDGRDQMGDDESAPYGRRWLCHYPASKARAEQLVLRAGMPGRELAACALRPHLIWGPRDRQLVPRLLARARQHKLVRVGDGSNWVDMVYVENAADAHLMALDALKAGKRVAGRAYYISQGDPVNCWKWIDRILDLAGLPPVGRSISMKAAWRIGSLFEAAFSAMNVRREPPMTRFLAAQLGLSHYFDIRRAREELGYSPQIPIAEGMRRLAVWLDEVHLSDPPGIPR